MPKISGQRSHVSRGVREFQDDLADDLGGSFRTKRRGVREIFCDDRELFNNEPVEVLGLNLLPSDEIEHDRVEIGYRRAPRTLPVATPLSRGRMSGRVFPTPDLGIRAAIIVRMLVVAVTSLKASA